MLSGQDMVCLSLTPWETRLPSTAHYLMREFGRTNRVLFVDHPLTLRDLADPAFLGSPRWRRTLGLQRALHAVPDPDRQIWVLTPPPTPPARLPATLYDAALKLSAGAVAGAIRRSLATLGMRDPLVWIAFDVPLGAHLVGKLGERLAIYLCYDEIAGEAYIARHGVRLEPEVMRLSDLIITTSSELQARCAARHPACHWVANGVEAEHFAQAQDPALEVPAALSTGPGPVIGYLGNLEARVDFQLLGGVARARPDWTLALVGPVDARQARDLEALVALPNVKWLGPCRYDEAPSYLKAFDVGLIPFVRTVQTRAIYPLKLNEYLAAGLPVVRTPFAELPEFDSACQVAVGVPDTVAAIERALGERDPESVARRQALAARHTWGARAEQLSILVAQSLRERQAKRPTGEEVR